MSRRRLRVATRASALARAQTALVIDLLRDAAGAQASDLDVEALLVETTGDRNTEAEIWQLGGRGVFVKEVQSAVLDGRADLAVHSAKDLPSGEMPGLVIAAVPERADPRDALVGSALDDLPPGARVGTGSIRRRAQLAWVRPDLTFSGLRGNIGTRMAKAPGFDAIVVAAAALARLGRLDEAAELLDPSIMLPQVGQGALAVECRSDDSEVRDLLALIDHPPSSRAVAAERAFLAVLGGGCDLPVGAYATVGTDGRTVDLTGLIASGDGRIVLRHSAQGDDGQALGRDVARHLLDRAGGQALLEEVAIN
ncbi:MAG: hydroxymethylbilane synthase [Acidimicrobiales bacterium]